MKKNIEKKTVKASVGSSRISPVKKAAVASTGIQKKYNKTNSSCKVAFGLPKKAVNGALTVMVVGDFNDWDENATPMEKLKSGEFNIILDLPSGNEYRFRYLIDGCHWENDWYADKYVVNPYGCDDSVVIV